MAFIEGSRQRTFKKAGVPANGDFNGEAGKGDLLSDTVNGLLYVNTGTLAATVWAVVGEQTDG